MSKAIIRALNVGGLIGLTLGLSMASRADVTFNMLFDGTFDNTLTPPIIGTGILTLATDPGVGTFSFASLNPQISFNVGGESFTQADNVSNPNLTELMFTNSGGVERIQFTDTGGGGGGPEGGSIDFANGGNIASFEPSYFGGDLDLYFTNGPEGTYNIFLNTPEPGGIALFSGLFVAAGIFGRTRRRKTTAAQVSA